MMPVSALHSIHFKPAEPDDPANAPEDEASAGGASGDGAGQSALPPEVDKLLQALLKQIDSSSTGNAATSPDAGSGQSPGARQGNGGIDPQLAEMLAYIARVFEAMLQRQQQESQDDGSAGVGGVDGGGGGGASALGGAAAPAAAQATATPAPASPATGGAPATGVIDNAGGVPQAAAIDGVAPNATKVVDTGTGTDRTFNVTNDTNTAKSFEYESEGQKKAVMTLAPGETEAFKAGSKDLGVRIENSDAQGNVKPNEQLFETGGADNGQAVGASNDDISNVDGDKDVDGNTEKMTDTLSDGKKAGDGNAIRPYQNPTDDAAAMGLAGDSSMTSNVVVSS